MPSPVPDSLLRQIVATYAPRRVILFGSRARGEAGPDSDLDLLVVLDDDVPAEALGHDRRYQARRDYHGAVDIIPWRDADLRRREHIRGSFAATIKREGVTVYEDPTKCSTPRPLREEELVTPAEEAAQWADRAARDLRAADLMLGVDQPDIEIAAFHLQQAAEKLVKALLILADQEVPKRHDLRQLADRLGPGSPIPPALAAGLAGLTTWAISGRYPDPPKGMDVPDAGKVKAAQALVAELRAIVAEALSKAG